MKDLEKFSDQVFFAVYEAAKTRMKKIKQNMDSKTPVLNTQIDGITNDILMAAQDIVYGSDDELVTMDNKKLNSNEIANLNKMLRQNYGDIIDIVKKYIKDRDEDSFFNLLEDVYNDDLDVLEFKGE